MSAFNSITTNDLTSNTLTLLGSIGNVGESIYNDGVNTLWYKQNKSAVFLDSTDSSQDLSTSPVAINFDTLSFNNIDLIFNNNSFIFNVSGIYQLNFSCLLSNSRAQNMISFRINGDVVYGNLSTFAPDTSSNIPFYISYIANINSGDILEIIGEKYNDGHNFLLKNPIYFTPVTKLEIITL